MTLANIDANVLDKNFADILDGSTGDFKDKHTKSREPLRKLLVENGVTARGNVVEAAVKSVTENKVEVLLLVDQAVSNVAFPAPQIDSSRIKMTMEKVDNRWLASKVELR